MKQFFYLLMLFITVNSYAQTKPTIDVDYKPSNKEWELNNQMSDEFNTSHGSYNIDESKWSKDPMGNGFNWVGRYPGLFDRDAVIQYDGKLIIKVDKYSTPKRAVDVYPSTDHPNRFDNWDYMGGIVRSNKTAGVGNFIEIRMKANRTEMSSTFFLKPKKEWCAGVGYKFNRELDIQECVGSVTANLSTNPNKRYWDQTMNTNGIRFREPCSGNSSTINNVGQSYIGKTVYSDFAVYGCYIETARRVHFYLNGKFQYTKNYDYDFNRQMHITMVAETYGWNPVPNGGGLVASETWWNKATQIDYVRTFYLKDKPTTTTTTTTGGDWTPLTTEDPVIYTITSSYSEKDIRSNSSGNNRNVGQAPKGWRDYYNRSNWEFIYVDSQHFYIKNAGSGLVLSPTTVGSDYTRLTETGTDIRNWKNQWRFIYLSNYRLRIENRYDGRLIMTPTKTDDLSTGGDTQYWLVPGGTYPWKTRFYLKYGSWSTYNKNGDSDLENAPDEIVKVSTKFDDLTSPLNNTELTIFPNPADNSVFITSDQNEYEIKISDLSGKLIISDQLGKNITKQIDISNLNAGVYLLQYRTENDSNFLNKKLIVK